MLAAHRTRLAVILQSSAAMPLGLPTRPSAVTGAGTASSHSLLGSGAERAGVSSASVQQQQLHGGRDGDAVEAVLQGVDMQGLLK